MAWSPNTKYTILLGGSIKSTDGEYLGKDYTSYFYSTFSPLWVNPQLITMDLAAYMRNIDPSWVYIYAYMASWDAYIAMSNNPDRTAPDPDLPLDQQSDDVDICYIECYVRYKTQYDLIGNALPNLVTGGSGRKQLGDFSIDKNVNVADVAAALDFIKPRMEECYIFLAGVFKHTAMPRVVNRASTTTARDRMQSDRSAGFPAGFRTTRNWDNI